MAGPRTSLGAVEKTNMELKHMDRYRSLIENTLASLVCWPLALHLPCTLKPPFAGVLFPASPRRWTPFTARPKSSLKK